MKRSTLLLTLMISSLTLISCGSDDDDNGSSRQEQEEGKNLFSVWRPASNSDSNLILDFRSYNFNQRAPFVLRTSDTILCSCAIEFEGNQSAGEFLISDCTGIPTCLDFIDTYRYDKNPNTLEICDSRNDCDDFQ